MSSFEGSHESESDKVPAEPPHYPLSTPDSTSFHSSSHRQRHFNNFANAKNQCLGKRDKSSAGRIDPKAVDICACINLREEMYTTSSCAGRCFLYSGEGIKSTSSFERFRVSHDLIRDAVRYFDLSTLQSDPTGGADPVRTIGQFEHGERLKQLTMVQDDDDDEEGVGVGAMEQSSSCLSHTVGNQSDLSTTQQPPIIWLRFEPFILHVACRSLAAAAALMNAARPSFKNVGLTTFSSNKYLVAIWGDEGLDMPLCAPELTAPSSIPTTIISSNRTAGFLFQGHCEWLAQLINARHERNWDKIERFVQAVRNMPQTAVDTDDSIIDENNVIMGQPGYNLNDKLTTTNGTKIPKHFDVIGDIAVLNALPEGVDYDDKEELKSIGSAILNKNKAIKIVVARQSNLVGTERAVGASGFIQLAGKIQRYPLVTSHAEYGIKCVIDLHHTFFSPRMGPERLRICQQVARGENVLVLFAGVGMEALQIAGRTEASRVVAVELNPVAVQCLTRSHALLSRNKAVKCIGAEERLDIIEGDVLRVLPEQLSRNFYDRVLAPRPKEGSLDGDLGTGDGGKQFLQALLPAMKQQGGECHWYDFCADHEYPQCERTRQLLEVCCRAQGLHMDVLHVANAGSVAKRQLRVCVDFRVSPM